MGPPPVVTGISPKDATPGIKITIRGENLGTSAHDLLDVIILGQDCLMSADWKSPTKIVALCPSNSRESRGQILVTTVSGGVGTCNVQFQFYREKITSPLHQVASWIPEKFHVRKGGVGGVSGDPSASSSSALDDALCLDIASTSAVSADSSSLVSLPDEFFEGKSSDVRASNFDPLYFLFTMHGSTPFEDLKHGRSYLQRKVAGENENQLSFIKSNVRCVVEQLDSLANVLKRHQKKEGGALIDQVDKSMVSAKREADRMFSQVLERKDTADATRNALNVLNRFKFVLFLPSNLESNLRKGDYERIIDEYERVETLYGSSDSEVFKVYMQEIRRGVEALKEKLWRLVMSNEEGGLEAQKKLISNLVQIDGEGGGGDPAWKCLQVRYSGMLGLMESTEKGGGGGDVERLTAVVADYLPDLWKLGQSYFKGDLGVVAPDSGKQVVFKEMVLGSIRYYGTLVRESMSEGEDEAAAARRMRFARQLHAAMIDLDLPNEALVLVVDLASELRLSCLQATFQAVVDKVNALKEDWEQEVSDEFGAVTKLPEEFLAIAGNSTVMLREVVERVNDQERNVLAAEVVAADTFEQLLQNVLSSFAFALENAAVEEEGEEDGGGGRGENESTKLLVTMNNGRLTLARILPKVVGLFRGVFRHDAAAVALLEAAHQGARSSYDVLVRKLLEAYLDTKCEPIVAIIEPCMYSGKFDWARCPRPVDSKDYVKGIVHDVASVCAELERTSSRRRSGDDHDDEDQDEDAVRVVTSVVESVAEEVNRLFCCISRMNSNGCIQAWVDINCLSLALAPFLNRTAVEYLEEASKPLLDLERPGDRETVDKCESLFRKTMSFHLKALGVA